MAAQRRARALCLSYAPRLKPGQYFSHVTAARLHGMPLPASFDSDHTLHVSTRSPARAPRAVGIRGHKHVVSARDVAILGDLPVSTPARVWIELAPLLTVEDLVCVGDYILWRRQPRASPEQLVQVVSGHRGLPGGGRLAEAVPLLSDRSDSPPESRIRYRFWRAGLPAPAVNAPVCDNHGILLAMPDLSFTRYRLAIDYEGDYHRTDRAQWEKDIGRVPRLEDVGWHSTRVSARDLRDSRELIARLRRLLRERGWSG
jgi:hypothetical protein